METAVSAARAFAVGAHGAQQYAGEPYVVHLDRVAGLVEGFGDEARVVGYLHDVVEDTAVPVEELRARFGERVAQCVLLVTDEKEGTRAEKKAKSHAKLARVGKEFETALIVKGADRLANLMQCALGGLGGGEKGEKKLAMYRGEHAAFRAAVYRAGLCEGLWERIEAIITR